MFNLEYSLQQIVAGGDVGGREIAFGLTSDDPRELHLGLLGMLLHCEEPERAIVKDFCEGAMSLSSSVQQVQLASAISKSFLNHKSSSSSTTTWEKREVNQKDRKGGITHQRR